MSNRSKLSKSRQTLALEWQGLVPILAGYFLAHRPAWQRASLRGDLEGEGYLALCKAARTYDPKRLPYPKAYFARAILNSMYKWIKRQGREPDGERLPVEAAEESRAYTDELDHLKMAIELLAEDDREFAADRFQESKTLRTLAGEYDISLKAASGKARELARQIAELLDIRLPEPRSSRR